MPSGKYLIQGITMMLLNDYIADIERAVQCKEDIMRASELAEWSHTKECIKLLEMIVKDIESLKNEILNVANSDLLNSELDPALFMEVITYIKRV